MAQHYTRDTVQAEAWCGPCNKRTPHLVNDRRLGACLVCVGKLNKQHDSLQMQHELYEERAAIKEFCGNMSREQAEREAHEEVHGAIPAVQRRLL